MSILATAAPARPTYASALAALILGVAVAALAVTFAGVGALAYLLVYAATLVPGLPLGFALFGRRHAAGWIAGMLCGYALTSLAIWLPVEFGLRGGFAAVGAWALLTAITWSTLRDTAALVRLPAWSRRDTLALVFVLAVVPLLVARPFDRIGERDDAGNQRYRAYFTADFLWHVALTAELARGDDAPRNPYMARRPLRYYWAYFVVPATVVRTTPVMPSIEAALEVNALCAGLLFVAALFVFAWCAVPRAVAAGAGVLLAVLASSAEGLYAAVRGVARGESFASLRHLNIDAITAWFHQGLTIDGLPRSIWYTPQHAAACALGLMGLLVAAHAGPSPRVRTSLLAGVALGLSLAFSPFLGGCFALLYGLTCAWAALRTAPRSIRPLLVHAAAAGPVLAALGWCVVNRTFEGAGGHVALGLSDRAMASPILALTLTLGPALVVALPALFLARNPSAHLQASAIALAFGLVLFYGVTLTAEPIWIGWRAGQIILVTIPALMAATLSVLASRGRRGMAVSLATLAVIVGLPTTAIDLHNAQDIANLEMGPGFRWTVSVPPDSQAALAWVRDHTPGTAVVQMSIKPRGRETWTLIPSLAERRMAAGQPISLLKIPEYTTDSARADTIFSIVNPGEAWRVARALDVDYVYMDRVERDAFGASLDKFNTPEYFQPVFQQGDAAVYLVR